MMKARILLPLVAVTLALLVPQTQAAPFMYEDFQGYPPGSVTIGQTTVYSLETFPIEGFYPMSGTGTYTTRDQDLDYALWDEVEEEGIIRWRIGREPSGNFRPRYLVYGGTDPENSPFEWQDYTARTVFEIEDTTLNHYVHLHVRMQEDHVDQEMVTGYSAHWHLRPSAPLEYRYRLLIETNNFWHNPDAESVLAASADTLIVSTGTLYTLEFIVQGSNLTANLYEGTDLSAPGALKLTVSGTDSTWTAGTVAIAHGTGTAGLETFFHSIEVIPEPTALGLFGVAGVVLFFLRGRHRCT